MQWMATEREMARSPPAAWAAADIEACVVIPSFQQPGLLAEAIASALGQVGVPPVAVVVVDTEERVRAFLPELDTLVTDGLVLLDRCEAVRYVSHEEPR